MAESDFPDVLCEVCKQQAVEAIQDLRDIEPVPNEKGELWARWKGDGPAHFFCKEHVRESKMTYLPSRSEAEARKMEYDSKRMEFEARAIGAALKASGGVS